MGTGPNPPPLLSPRFGGPFGEHWFLECWLQAEKAPVWPELRTKFADNETASNDFSPAEDMPSDFLTSYDKTKVTSHESVTWQQSGEKVKEVHAGDGRIELVREMTEVDNT